MSCRTGTRVNCVPGKRLSVGLIVGVASVLVGGGEGGIVMVGNNEGEQFMGVVFEATLLLLILLLTPSRVCAIGDGVLV